MKYFSFFSFFIFYSSIVFGQQNFFNVPSSDITQKNKIFFQQQVNVSEDGLQSNSTFNLGLGHNFEIGLNYLNFTFMDEKKLYILMNDTIKPYDPFFTFNMQKRFNLSQYAAISLGGQYGFASTKRVKTGGYFYSNFIYYFDKIELKVIAGLYFADKSFFGEGDRLVHNSPIGIQSGIEKKIWKNKLLFQADFISGKHNIGEVVVGAAYFLSKNWVFSAGYQIPTFNSKSINSVVFELTYNPK